MKAGDELNYEYIKSIFLVLPPVFLPHHSRRSSISSIHVVKDGGVFVFIVPNTKDQWLFTAGRGRGSESVP